MGDATNTTLDVATDVSLPADFVTKTCAILAQRRKGKRLALNTPLPTPSGWTTMGDIRVGDRLFDELGEPCRVTYVGEVADGDSYRVRFSDGAEIVADAEHLWVTESRAARRRESAIRVGVLTGAGREGRPQCEQDATTMPQIRTTAEIAETLYAGGETNHSIPVAFPLDLPDAELPIDPYVLGLWLGDGTRGFGAVTSHDRDYSTLDEVRRAGYEIREQPSQRRGQVSQYTILGLRPLLAALGVLREKFVPTAYLRASETQRLALLQGLADSDGSCSEQGQVELSFSDERLAAGAYELVVSLGIKATRAWRETSHRPSCRIRFSTHRRVFRLDRKVARQKAISPALARRFIVSVEATASVPMRCISVDSSSRLYLAGDAMIPTHNTYTGAVLAEELVNLRLPFVALDPTGAWWGLRASADGQSAGLPVVVIGGQHGDLPLERGAGGFVADLVLDHPGYYVLDLSLLESRAAEREFATAFGLRLHRRKMQPGMDFPLHLFVDEADMFVPQEREMKADTQVLGAYQAIVRRGGLHGLGTTLISQRPALVNKSVLTQLDLLIILRLVGGQDQDAVDRDYIKRNASKEQREAVMGSLASLKLGEAWVFEPGADLLARVQIRERRTFNSSATPKPGERRVEPRVLADVDIDALRDRMATTLERAKQEDPTELRKRIRELERAIAEKTDELARQEIVERQVEIEIVVPDPAVLELASEAIDRLRAIRDGAYETVSELEGKVRPFYDKPVEAEPKPPPEERKRETLGESSRPAASPRSAPPTASANGNVDLATGARHLLGTLANHHPVRLTVGQLALLARRKARGGAWNTAMKQLREGGYVREENGLLFLTETGIRAGGADPNPLSAADLRDRWREALPAAAREVFDRLLAVYPNGRDPEALAAELGRKAVGGSWNTAIATLTRNGLAEREGGILYATAEAARG